MKLKVKVDEQLFEVEIGSLYERPITAKVDGEVFEIWPESRQVYTSRPANRAVINEPVSPPVLTAVPVDKTASRASLENNQAASAVKAPIPGIITMINTQIGDEVQAGQELCKLEAMKMNNSIRASRPGRIASILVSVGQKVKHGDVLMEYGED
jgi:biotin carboxyl carrier protein